VAFPPITRLIPHQGPAVLIDEVLEHRDDETLCAAFIREDMQYVRDGRADAAIALELMAQTVAAHVGLRGRWSGAEPRQGYVVGVPRMRFFGGSYSVGDRLSVLVRAVFVEGPVARFEGRVHEGQALRAEGSLTVFEPPVSSGGPTS
jgi:predicted hotdog family 3-hydroxylacyl-ACP dehydratase